MSTLRLGTVSLSSATLEAPNPLPPLGGRAAPDVALRGEGFDAQMRRNVAYGHVPSTLPYLTQDRYDRARTPRDHRVAVLEDAHLRAEFLLDLGGRLRSLVDVTSGRELLHANPSFQPANLAVRDAWFSGGVEWNIGMRGHSPLTCSPLHAARVDGPGGTPVLRMWEYERIREVVFQVDCWLSGDRPVLLVAVRIVNPNPHVVPMYWWSNIAVPESGGVRVLAPGDAAWAADETGSVSVVDLPGGVGRSDRTYPERADRAMDYFVRLGPVAHPWVAAVQDTGWGLLQSSTRQLRGRKLFVWGSRSAGGRHWQEWLTPEAPTTGGEYFEIQAGLLPTQLEHTEMPAESEWSWVETYGPIQVDPVVAHGADWSAARAEVERALQRVAPDDWLSDRAAEAELCATTAPAEALHRGSGWGALEHSARPDLGIGRPATPMAESTLGTEQHWWRALLDGDEPPPADPAEPPPAYQVGTVWLEALAASTWDDWTTWLMRGVAQHHAGDRAAAALSWRTSFRRAANAWALRNLAVVEPDPAEAARLLGEAVALAPAEPALLVELVERLLGMGLGEKALGVIAAAPAAAATPPVRLLQAHAAALAGDVDTAERLLAGLVLPGVREGSRSLDELWFRIQALRLAQERGTTVDEALLGELRRTAALPYELDFRLSP